VISEYLTRRGAKEGATMKSLVRLFAISESRIMLDSFLTSTLDGTEFRLTLPPLYPEERAADIHCVGGVLGPTVWVLQRKVDFFPLP